MNCQHPACSCEVSDNKEFCSSACAGEAGESLEACECPHTDCEGHAIETKRSRAEV